MNLLRNYSAMFDAYDDGRPSPLKRWLRYVGIIGFISSAMAGLVMGNRGEAIYQDGSILSQLLMWVFPAGFAVGLLAFVALGINYVGRQQGRSGFITSVVFVLSKVFLYIVLPGLILTGALVLWGVLTHQPAFQ